MATVTKKPSGGFQAAVRKQGYPPQYKTFPTKREARDWGMEVEAAINRGEYFSHQHGDKKMLLKDAIDQYIIHVEKHQKGSAQKVQRLERWRELYGDFSLENMSPPALTKYRDSRLEEVANSTVRNDLTVLSSLYEHAIREWHIGGLENPVKKIRLPSIAKARRNRRVSQEEIDKLVANAPSRLASVINFAVFTAARRAEICNLRWPDVNLSKRTAVLRETKNGDDRTIPLSKRAVELLESMEPKDKGRVFGFPSPESITSSFGDVKRRLGITDLHFHDLRHEATSRIIESGVFHNAIEVAAITGHKTLNVLQVYYNSRPEQMADRMSDL